MNRLLLILKIVFLTVIIEMLDVNPPAVAQEQLTGRWIAQQVFDRDRGQNSISTATMVLVDKKGNKRSRTFTNRRILEQGLEKQIIRFTAPADIDGTGFLTIEKSGYKTDQFLYLPALRRTRRIVSSQKSHRFVNSDFTYEDMERHPVDDYLYDIKGEETIGHIECYILEIKPKKGVASQYSLMRSHISKTSFVPIFTEYFDQKGRQVKTYTVIKLELQQHIWTETLVKMENAVKAHKTFIKILNIEYNTPVTVDQISKAALENY